MGHTCGAVIRKRRKGREEREERERRERKEREKMEDSEESRELLKHTRRSKSKTHNTVTQFKLMAGSANGKNGTALKKLARRE